MIEPLLAPVRSEITGLWEYQLQQEWLTDDHILLPPFFSTDGATIPTLAQPLICTPYDPEIMQDALVHDWEYTAHLRPRVQADTRLRLKMLARGFSGWKATAVYDALREFGGGHWENSVVDLHYIEWLKAKLVAAGYEPERYFRSAEVAA